MALSAPLQHTIDVVAVPQCHTLELLVTEFNCVMYFPSLPLEAQLYGTVAPLERTIELLAVSLGKVTECKCFMYFPSELPKLKGLSNVVLLA